MVSESLGLTSHKSSCNCTGCGMLRAGGCINCAEKTAALIIESGPGEIAVEPCSGACREAIELYFSTPPELLARAAQAMSAALAALSAGRDPLHRLPLLLAVALYALGVLLNDGRERRIDHASRSFESSRGAAEHASAPNPPCQVAPRASVCPRSI